MMFVLENQTIRKTWKRFKILKVTLSNYFSFVTLVSNFINTLYYENKINFYSTGTGDDFPPKVKCSGMGYTKGNRQKDRA